MLMSSHIHLLGDQQLSGVYSRQWVMNKQEKRMSGSNCLLAFRWKEGAL
jgi:hypothetical protein